MITDEKSVTKTSTKRLPLQKLYFICLVSLIIVFLFDLFIPLGVAVGVLYVVVVLLTLWTPHSKATVVAAILSSLLIITVFFYKPSVAEMWKVIFNRGISLFAVWVVAILGLQRNKTLEQRSKILFEREEALNEIRVLRGFLPICASCKKIRDDNGYWQQIEGYIRDHSEAEFTHSICPSCAEKLYPDLNKRK